MSTHTKPLDEKELDFFIANNMNVLFTGWHGVGKTAMIKAAAERNNLDGKWRYFSAATMDPWVDFVGIPKERVGEDGESYIELVRPKGFHNDTVELIVLDELNRAKAKVRNAVMELIQFKAINGVKYHNLRMVWAAINPEDPDDPDSDLSYDVEALDPAQKDRFQIHIEIPYLPSPKYFKKNHGESGTGAVEWWNGLPQEQKMMVSPRRLEYAIEYHALGGDIRRVLSQKELNIQQLRTRLSVGSVAVKLENLFTDDNVAETAKAFSNINFATDALIEILKKKKYVKRFIEHIPKDMVSKEITENDGAQLRLIADNAPDDFLRPILASLVASGELKRPLENDIKKIATERGMDLTSEKEFLTAIEEGIQIASTTRGNRYNALHAVSGKFNMNADLDAYEQCIHFLSMIVYHTDDGPLKVKNKPFYQLGSSIIQRVDQCVAKFSTTSMEIWENTVSKKIPDEKRVARITEFLQMFMDAKV
jgi:hypothetical protein